jgi:hypothetical protein
VHTDSQPASSRLRRLALAALVVPAALAVGACGDDDEPAETVVQTVPAAPAQTQPPATPTQPGATTTPATPTQPSTPAPSGGAPDEASTRADVARVVDQFTDAVNSGDEATGCRMATTDFTGDDNRRQDQSCADYINGPDRYVDYREQSFRYEPTQQPPAVEYIIQERDNERTRFLLQYENNQWLVDDVAQLQAPG